MRKTTLNDYADITNTSLGLNSNEMKEYLTNNLPSTFIFEEHYDNNIINATSSTGIDNEYKTQDYNESDRRIYLQPSIYGHYSKAEITVDQIHPFYLDGSENLPGNITENLIGYINGAPLLMDEETATIESLLNLKQHTLDEDHLDTEWLQNLWQYTTKYGTSYINHVKQQQINNLEKKDIENQYKFKEPKLNHYKKRRIEYQPQNEKLLKQKNQYNDTITPSTPSTPSSPNYYNPPNQKKLDLTNFLIGTGLYSMYRGANSFTNQKSG